MTPKDLTWAFKYTLELGGAYFNPNSLGFYPRSINFDMNSLPGIIV